MTLIQGTTCTNCQQDPCRNGKRVNKTPHRGMQASLGKIEDPDMDEDELETRLLTVETAVKGVGKTAKGEFKCNTRVQRNNHPTPEDWSYPTDWKKQDCHYYCIQSQEEEEEDD